MNKIKNILNSGINSNVLKTIAVIAMVIDHIGFYFSPVLPHIIYVMCRAIGRIAMPVFVYILVQGFFHTKDFKKYILRIGILAVITQILISIIMVINITCVPSFVAVKQVYIYGNILFTFVLALGAMKILHEGILVKKWTYNKNLSLRIILIVIIFTIGILVPIDYGAEVLVISIFMYYLEKLKITVMLEKNKQTLNIQKIVLNTVDDRKIRYIYLGLVVAILFVLVIYFNAYWTTLLAVIPISLYNEESGRKNLKYLYYIIFPLQHILLYSLALILTLT